ncbi:9-O-acetylesterase [Neptunitalea chrysea]|uniref:9-O-acetylesterase n=2 Tax=Neptunitalea chrysea TaxID=1647581 RepID=A0A9W6B6P9_9FLAO|nr:9-O-acetylesterase [Neptunitalea chrysea]
MVLQKDSEVPFFGEADPGVNLTITTSWDFKNYKTKVSKEGTFEVTLHTPDYGGPYEIAIQQHDEVTTLKNILIGEVWLCSGQSNMEMPLEGWGKVQNYEEEIANANYPEIRLLQVAQVNAVSPVDTLSLANEGWQECSPKTIPEFSSTAYFFAREIYKTKQIPIGVIHSSWGGTVIEAWTSAGALHTIQDFDRDITALNATEAEIQVYNQENATKLENWHQQIAAVDEGYENDNPVWSQKMHNDWKSIALPGYFDLDDTSELFKFDGVVWFQKEINLTREEASAQTLLHFYADDIDKVWINGEFIGETDGYQIERKYQIPTGVLKPGVNLITIKVFDGVGGGGVYGDSEDFYLQCNDTKKLLGGNWKYKIGVSLDKVPPYPYIPMFQNRPTVLFNAMIHPILKFPFKGVIWYQGESNAQRAAQYKKLFPLLIKDWRKQFNNPKMPFYFVQLANYRSVKEQPAPSAWAELRDAQFITLKKVSNTGMAVAIDIGDAIDIHPKNKQEVGRRLALIALANVYGEDIAYAGPMINGYKKLGKNIVVSFEYSEGLIVKDGEELKGFQIAGPDKKFYWADAIIKGGKVVVSSSKVPNPVSVRYGWADNPEVNLYNGAGLPASPFKTDSWKGITLDHLN